MFLTQTAIEGQIWHCIRKVLYDICSISVAFHINCKLQNLFCNIKKFLCQAKTCFPWYLSRENVFESSEDDSKFNLKQ